MSNDPTLKDRVAITTAMPVAEQEKAALERPHEVIVIDWNGHWVQMTNLKRLAWNALSRQMKKKIATSGEKKVNKKKQFDKVYDQASGLTYKVAKK